MKRIDDDDFDLYDLTNFELMLFAGGVAIVGFLLFVVFAVVWGITP